MRAEVFRDGGLAGVGDEAAEFQATANRKQHRINEFLGAHVRAIKSRTLALLFGKNHIVGYHERARTEPGIKKVKTGDIEILPQIQQHKVNRAGKRGKSGEGVAQPEID